MIDVDLPHLVWGPVEDKNYPSNRGPHISPCTHESQQNGSNCYLLPRLSCFSRQVVRNMLLTIQKVNYYWCILPSAFCSDNDCIHLWITTRWGTTIIWYDWLLRWPRRRRTGCLSSSGTRDSVSTSSRLSPRRQLSDQAPWHFVIPGEVQVQVPHPAWRGVWQF